MNLLKLLFKPKSKKEFYRSLYNLLKFHPSDYKIYEKAFIHKSASIVVSGQTINNERLEYLGDAVIDTIIADYLFNKYKNKDEGFLTKLRSKIVKREQLNCFAKMIEIDKFIISQSNMAENKHIYGNTLEALIGAIFIDKGYLKTKKFFINRVLEKLIDLDDLRNTESDFKSRLIEWGQKSKQEIQFDSQEEPETPKNSPVFTSNVIIDGKVIGKGLGYSKKEAEQNAANQALEYLDKHK